MQRSTHRLKLNEIGPHVKCVLCLGYLIDATTIVECLHSFCRSCLLNYLSNNNIFCPICDVQIHKTNPLLSIKPDKTLQDIVYKLVPGLFRSEMRRRREFYLKHPQKSRLASPEERGVGAERVIYSPDDSFSLSLEYYDVEREREERESSSSQSSESGTTDSSSNSEQPPSPLKRYLQCPALVTIAILKKFIRMKFDLTPSHRVEVFHRRVSLANEYTLLDVAYIYTWKGSGPMRFFYRITEVPLELTPLLLPVEPTLSSSVETDHKLSKTETEAAAATVLTTSTVKPPSSKPTTREASTSKTQPLVVQTSKQSSATKTQQNMPSKVSTVKPQRELVSKASTCERLDQTPKTNVNVLEQSATTVVETQSEKTPKLTSQQNEQTSKTTVRTQSDQPSKVLPKELDQAKTIVKSQVELAPKVTAVKQTSKSAVKTQQAAASTSKAGVAAAGKRSVETKTKLQVQPSKSSVPTVKNQQEQLSKPMTVKMKLEQLKCAKSKLHQEQVSQGTQESVTRSAVSKGLLEQTMATIKAEKQESKDDKSTALASDNTNTQVLVASVKEESVSNKVVTKSKTDSCFPSSVKDMLSSEPSTSTLAVTNKEREEDVSQNSTVKTKSSAVKPGTNLTSKSIKDSATSKASDKQSKNVTHTVTSMVTLTSDKTVSSAAQTIQPPKISTNITTPAKPASCTETSSAATSDSMPKTKSTSDVCRTNLSDSKQLQCGSVSIDGSALNAPSDAVENRDSKCEKEVRVVVDNADTGLLSRISPSKVVGYVHNTKKNPNQQILTKNEEIIKPHTSQKRPQFNNETLKRKLQVNADLLNKNKNAAKKSRAAPKPGLMSAVKRLQESKVKTEPESPVKKFRPNETSQPGGSGVSQMALCQSLSGPAAKELGIKEEKLVPNQLLNKPSTETVKLEPHTSLPSKTELSIPVPKSVHNNRTNVDNGDKPATLINTKTKDRNVVDSKTSNHVGISNKKTCNHSPSYSYLKSAQSNARDTLSVNNELMHNPQHTQVSAQKKETDTNKVLTPIPKLIELTKSVNKKLDGSSTKINVQKTKQDEDKDLRQDPRQDGIGAWDLTSRPQIKPQYLNYPLQPPKLPHTFTSPPLLSPTSPTLFPAPSHSIRPMSTQLKIPNLSRLPQQRSSLSSSSHHRGNSQVDGSPVKLRRPDFQNRMAANLPQQAGGKRVDGSPQTERHSEKGIMLSPNPTSTSRMHEPVRVGTPLPSDFRTRIISSPLRDHRRTHSSSVSPKSLAEDKKSSLEVAGTSRAPTLQEMTESAALRQQLEMQARLWGAGAPVSPEWFQDPNYVKRLDTFMKSLGRGQIPQTAIFPSNSKSNNS